MSAFTTVTVKYFKDKNRKANWCRGGGQIQQHKICIWSLSNAIEQAVSRESGMAQSTYCTQTIKHKFEIKIPSLMSAMLF